MRATSSVDPFHTSVDMEDAVLAHGMQIHLFSLGRQHNQTPLYFHLGFSVLWFTGICAKALITGFVQGEIFRELVLWYFAGVTYKDHRIMEKLELEGTHKDQFITRIYCCWFIACVCFLYNSLNCMTSKCIEHSWWEIEHCEYKSLDGFKTMDIFLYLFEFCPGNNSLKKKFRVLFNLNFGSLAQLSQAPHLENLTGAGFSFSLVQQGGHVGTQHVPLHQDTDLTKAGHRENWLSLNLLYTGTPAPSSLCFPFYSKSCWSLICMLMTNIPKKFINL